MSHNDPVLPPQTLASVCASARVQPYRFIHKGLRVLMLHTLRNAGALDCSHAAERAQLVDEVERLLSVCADHLAHENRYFHEPLRERAPRAVRAFHDDHLDHLAAIDELRLLLQRVRDAESDAPALAYELYLSLSTFIGENLAHMAEEESTLTRALWEHFSDAEINALVAALEATLSPQEMGFYLGWMARGLNVAELAQLLGEARPAVPPAVFTEMTDTVRAALDTPRWARLAATLGIPAVPGLVGC